MPPNSKLGGTQEAGGCSPLPGAVEQLEEEEGHMGRGSEDLVEQAGLGLAGGASLRARLLMSAVCTLGPRDLPGQDQD